MPLHRPAAARNISRLFFPGTSVPGYRLSHPPTGISMLQFLLDFSEEIAYKGRLKEKCRLMSPAGWQVRLKSRSPPERKPFRNRMVGRTWISPGCHHEGSGGLVDTS